jgi:tRNA dimethylallyltransferase
MAVGQGRRIILLAGPTASGKSALAAQWAQACGGLVVNADSMQVYSDLRVLTARPDPEEERRTPHMLYGHVDGAKPYSVALWLDDVRRLLAGTDRRPLIFVGGTGLYLQALTQGLSEVPPIDEAVREHWRGQSALRSAADLHGELVRRDAAAAERIRASDTQRILRALEVVESTGRSLLEWQSEVSPALVQAGERFLLIPARSEVRVRIAERFRTMILAGGLDEVRILLQRGLDPSLPVMRAIGVAPLAAHLEGRLRLDEAVERAITDSRQYAKRQTTWMRNRFADWQPAPASF